MEKMHKIQQQEVEKIKEMRKKVKDKKEDKRLYAVQLRAERKTNQEIAEKLDTSDRVVSNWICKYVKEGIEGLLSKRQKGNHRNMTFEQEEELLKKYEDKAKKGTIITVEEIKREYEEKVGHKIGSGQIYKVLKRHKWRKIIPRSKHPIKASEEVIESSKKKLTTWEKN